MSRKEQTKPTRKSKAADGPKERGFPVAISWVLFLVLVIVGAGFISSPDPTRQVIGFVMLFAPLVVFSVIMALFYWRNRRYALAQTEAKTKINAEAAAVAEADPATDPATDDETAIPTGPGAE